MIIRESKVIVPKGTTVLWGVRCVDAPGKGPDKLWLTEAEAWWVANKLGQDVNAGIRPRHKHEIYSVPKDQWSDRYEVADD